MNTDFQNIAERISFYAQKNPQKTAVYFPEWSHKKSRYIYQSINYKELDQLIHKFSVQLFKLGLRKGDKTLLFLRPSLEFHAMVFALFRSGIIPVLIDPGMGKENLLKCIKETGPIGLIAEKEIHFIKHFFPKSFKTVKFAVTNGKLILPKFLRKLKTISVEQMKKEKQMSFSTVETNPHDLAALLFTSGGTGIPKGVEYTHFIFNQQTNILQSMFNLSEDDVDLPGFPLFSLFTLAMGMTSIIPDMDPSKPSHANPKKLARHIQDLKPTFVAGSPAIWERLADYAIKEKLTFPSVKHLAMFGAPVSLTIHRKFKPLLPFGTTYTPYGATESLPVTNISGDYILKHTAKFTEDGMGTCIGLKAPNIEIKLIPITDDVIEHFTDQTKPYSTPHRPGEIIVKGPVVTAGYYGMPEKTREAKIYEDNSFWHRMGDVGYFDEEGKLWFLGRKAHVLWTDSGFRFPIPTEAIFNKHPDIKRTALVGIGEKGKQKPAIVIERNDGQFLMGREKNVFESELIQLAKNYEHTKDIQLFYYSHGFPVDVRHNIKIDRQRLKREIESNEAKS